MIALFYQRFVLFNSRYTGDVKHNKIRRMVVGILVDDREESLYETLVHVLREDASERQRSLVQLFPPKRLVLDTDIQFADVRMNTR